MSKLAINGGPKVRTKLFPSQITTGEGRESEVARRVKEQEKIKGGVK